MSRNKPKATRPRPFLSARVDPELHAKFHQIGERYGGASELLRLVAEAVVAGQIVVTIPKTRPTFEVKK